MVRAHVVTMMRQAADTLTISVLNSSLWTAVDKRSEAFVPRLLISNKS